MFLRKQTMKMWIYTTAAAIGLAPGAMTMAAQTAAAVPMATAQAAPASAGTRVHGTVVDPDGSLIPGAKVTLTPSKGAAAKQMSSGSDGTYSLTVPPGTYTLVVQMPGFATYSALNMKVLPGVAGQTFDVKMQVGTDVTINVDDTAAQLSVDPDSNASATVLAGKDLDALSDDPDDLQSELEALAGPAAGPNGAQFYIDGFTGGQLPPKQSIREIRINQNPFSAQYDKPGFGRVEIFTKPGSDQFHGGFQFNANDNALNTGSPIVQAGVPQPAYHTFLLNGQISGPINKNSSFTFGGQYRDIQNNSIIDPESLYSEIANPGTPCAPGQTTGCETLNFLQYTAAVAAPQTRYDVSPRVDLALGANNTLTMRYRDEHATLNNQGIGGIQLPDNAYTATQGEQDVQISENATLSQKVINEIHFEWQRSSTADTPLNTTPQLSVAGGFVTGGDASTGTTKDVQNHFEYQNYTSIALAHNFIRFGGRVRQTFDTNTTNANSNGSFTFLSTATATALQNYINGTPSQFSIVTYNQPTTKATTVDAGLYAEDDWKPKPNVTFSYGVRYETQNFIHDKADFAPRVALAYGVGKKKSGGPAVVVRAGFGLFYDRLALGNQLDTVQENGTNQVPSTTTNVPFSNAAGSTCSTTVVTGCGATPTAGHVQTQEVQTKANFSRNYRSPYQEQTNLGADIQPFKYATVSFNYQHVVGIHQLLNANLNAAADVTDPNAPIKNTYLTEGYYRQNQFITNFNYRGSARWSLSSFYVINFDTKSDTAGVSSQPTDPYNIGADFGRASFDIKNQLFLFGSFNFPHLISVSPLVAARSGTPVNITTGEDNFGYLTNNTRPIFATAGTPGAKTFAGCGTFVDPGKSPGAPYAQIPTNYCTGPASFTTNVRISKTIGFGQKKGVAGVEQGRGPGQGGPPPGSGGPGGGGHRGGGGGGGFHGGVSSGRKYNLVLAVQFQNLFNVVDRAAPNGTLSSPSFGQLTGLAGSLFTTNDAVRRVQLSASFNF
ncbi:carboxypeptidase regulatory-like domain-containing protein [Granulicella sp. 5B5]|uniref:TonB-dependent receptor n=1 Tax=Granulicella sp. 5B5 TaxID=1617967 RepID=UPI0015F5CC2B|nr:TonB-dependent receptor [Granulicella sp. 5B5]QMV18192.1 carboxypeptidase regulatory-like domain-containing protein [Granulicella sp. 5B5]